MRVADGHFPKTDVTGDGGEKLGERQRYDHLQVVAFAELQVQTADPHESQGGLKIDEDGAQLDHGDSDGKRKDGERHLADDVVHRGNGEPEHAEHDHSDDQLPTVVLW